MPYCCVHFSFFFVSFAQKVVNVVLQTWLIALFVHHECPRRWFPLHLTFFFEPDKTSECPIDYFFIGISIIYSSNLQYYYSKEFVYNTKRFGRKIVWKFASFIFQAEKYDLKKFLNDLFTESSEIKFKNGWINKEKKLV